MNFRSNFAKSALASVAGVVALSAAATVPTFAAAQSNGYYAQDQNGGYYDPCRRSTTNRGTAGALIGGALGAVIGSNAAARNARTEGALLGGALGAVAGGAVGSNSAACQSSRRSSDYDNGSRYGSSGYSNGGYYAGSYDRDRYDDRDRDYAYDRRGTAYNVTERPGADGCTLAESPIYLPDGRVQKRFVRVCQDGQGNYQVVD
ncbi:glycine zipper 2TM domain-containing protein [Phenylobacterium sp.]|uniref:glycine zipper 2TM domain-containing protein n=1 Tax=Phenylobacterium sp. TaxID=1871053 RepID=UPI00286A59E4|nr:glycine zipper 2TM domain-containing protein [Phenylobacterium sp.]